MVKVLYNGETIELKDELEEGFEELDYISDNDLDFDSIINTAIIDINEIEKEEDSNE